MSKTMDKDEIRQSGLNRTAQWVDAAKILGGVFGSKVAIEMSDACMREAIKCLEATLEAQK